MRWMWAAVLAAAVTTLAAPGAVPAQASVEPDPPAASGGVGTGIGTRIGATVAELSAALADPNATATQRNEAARRLVARQTDEAREALRQVVTSAGNAPARAAAVLALADDPAPAPVLIPDLLGLLNNESERAAVEAAAQALANYKDDPQVLAELSAAAASPGRRAPLRVPIIRALGQFVELDAAATLVRILGDRAAPPEVTAAAADALVELTALEDNGRDAGRWQQWFQENGKLDEAEWKAAVLRGRSRRHDRQRREAAAMGDDLEQLLEDQYTAAADKPQTLLRYLNMATPEIRRAGARLANRVAREAGEITDDIRTRLLDLVGDADPGVRLAVARALVDINIDPDRVLPPLLAQLRVETNSDVKVAIIMRLSPPRIAEIARLQALRELIESLSDRLNDGSPAVVREAAVSIGKRAPEMLERDKALTRAVAARLRDAMTRLARQPGSLDARKACGDALALLRDPENLNFARNLLNTRQPPEDPAIRGVALNILGELGSQAIDIIVGRIENERDPAVRAEGMRALARTRSFDQAAEWLVQQMARKNEPDADVNKAAAKAYLDLRGTGTIQKLFVEAQRRKNMPSLRIPVLRVLVEKLKQAKKFDDAAVEQQNLADDLLKVVRRPAEAVPHFRAALDHWRQQGAPPGVTARLIPQLIDAMLQSRQYAELTALASDLITKSPPADAKNYQLEFGSRIRTWAEQLKKNDDLDNATALIDAALKMEPALDERFRRDLENTRKEVEALRGAVNGGGAVPRR